MFRETLKLLDHTDDDTVVFFSSMPLTSQSTLVDGVLRDYRN